MTTFKLGVYQGQPVQGDIAKTLQLMGDVITEAANSKVQLLVFPELFVTGYLPELWERIPTETEEEEWMERLTADSKQHDVWIAFGHPSYRVPAHNSLDRRVNPHVAAPFTNAISLLSPAGVIGTYAKVHLFGDEPKTFVYGSEFPVWETPFGRVALQSCYDIEFPESARIAALQGADIVINPANNMSPFAEHHRRYSMVRAMENALFVATVNRVGSEKDIDFCGATCVAHPAGKWLLETDKEEALKTVNIDLSDIQLLDPSVHYLNQRRPVLYQALTESKDMNRREEER